jgi:hypothetical protein
MSLTVALVSAALVWLGGCGDPPPKPYGEEHALEMPGLQTDVWAVAPAINLSGHSEVDPILQADLLYQQLQSVHGLTVVPVDRVVQVYQGLNIERISSLEQAALVCDILQVDAIIVPTVTAYDPYTPPKMAASLALFRKPTDYVRPVATDALSPSGRPKGGKADLKQAVGMYDAADGSTRKSLQIFAEGRTDPNGPMAEREYFLSMDRYSGYVYHQLIADLLGVPPEPIDTEKSK